MLPIRNISYLSPMCCNFWEKCINSHKIDQGCSNPLKPASNVLDVFSCFQKCHKEWTKMPSLFGFLTFTNGLYPLSVLSCIFNKLWFDSKLTRMILIILGHMVLLTGDVHLYLSYSYWVSFIYLFILLQWVRGT